MKRDRLTVRELRAINSALAFKLAGDFEDDDDSEPYSDAQQKIQKMLAARRKKGTERVLKWVQTPGETKK